MRKFCKNCDHKSVPDLLKFKFNECIRLTFVECPMNDPQIYGCTIKFLEIDWINFFNYIAEKGLLNKNELSELGKEGWELS